MQNYVPLMLYVHICVMYFYLLLGWGEYEELWQQCNYIGTGKQYSEKNKFLCQFQRTLCNTMRRRRLTA